MSDDNSEDQQPITTSQNPWLSIGGSESSNKLCPQSCEELHQRIDAEQQVRSVAQCPNRRMTSAASKRLKRDISETAACREAYVPTACLPAYVPTGPPMGLSTFTPEEQENYNKLILETDGFDCGGYVPPGITPPGMLLPLKVPEGGEKFSDDMAKLAISDYNKKNDTSYQFVKVIRGTFCSGMYWWHNITFQAKLKEAGSPPQNFQARVRSGMGGDRICFCRFEQRFKPTEGLEERQMPPLVDRSILSETPSVCRYKSKYYTPEAFPMMDISLKLQKATRETSPQQQQE